MPETTHAKLQEEAGRTTLRFERILAHPPERVWRALTEKDELEGLGVPSAWLELNRDYEQRFGISHERATPPPSA
ncbi:MAG: hypothetical protein JWL67_150 [Solirubrobacterales bacterium]|jgi:uncharacterized protein YndB with AHSA1/START domain|nr:hypothetical protein [Solirubrobacterales bacterium]